MICTISTPNKIGECFEHGSSNEDFDFHISDVQLKSLQSSCWLVKSHPQFPVLIPQPLGLSKQVPHAG
jgi:hypothetical protein